MSIDNVETSPEIIPLQQQSAPQGFAPVVIPVAGQLHSFAGMLGPDIATNTGAAVNGIAIVAAPAANTLTLSITGPGTMAQRNAIAAVADEANADATDLATALTLLNSLKAKMNDLLGKARTAGHLTP